MSANPIDDDFNQSPEDLAIWLDRKYARHGEDEDRQAAAMLRQYAALTAAQQQQRNPWQEAVDRERVSAHLGIAADGVTCEEAARQLAELIDWHVKVATDPAVNGGLSLQPAQQQGQACECPIPVDDPPDMHAPGCVVRQPKQQGGGEVVDAVRFLAGVRVFLASRERIKQPEGLRMFDEAIEILRKTHEVDNA